MNAKRCKKLRGLARAMTVGKPTRGFLAQVVKRVKSKKRVLVTDTVQLPRPWWQVALSPLNKAWRKPIEKEVTNTEVKDVEVKKFRLVNDPNTFRGVYRRLKAAA